MSQDRIYQGEGDLWYFNVRGKLVKGPYTSYQAAELALAEHIRRCRYPIRTSIWSKPLRALKLGRATEPRHT
jgi:hypothetical protein